MRHRDANNMIESKKTVTRVSPNSMCFREEDCLVVAIIMILINASLFFQTSLSFCFPFFFLSPQITLVDVFFFQSPLLQLTSVDTLFIMFLEDFSAPTPPTRG